MKKSLSFLTLLCLMAFSLVFLPSCAKDEKTVDSADTKELAALVANCETLLGKASDKDYPAASIATFKATVESVKVALTTTLSSAAVTNLTVQLTEAKVAFLASAYGAIPADKLLLEWSFDEGKGTALTSTGTQKWSAAFAKGPAVIFGADTQIPTFVPGVKGQALNFDKGGFLQVADYTPSVLLSNTLSISMWVNPAKASNGNYLLSMNYWNNWKLNLQNEGKPFFTVTTTLGGVDADNETVESVPVNTWTHLVVSLDLNAHTLSFYINGELTKTWNAEGKANLNGLQAAAYMPKTGNKLPFIIGCATTIEEATAAWSEWFKPELGGAWDCFYGKMDEVKIYNIALTAGQASKLYNDEKAK